MSVFLQNALIALTITNLSSTNQNKKVRLLNGQTVEAFVPFRVCFENSMQ